MNSDAEQVVRDLRNAADHYGDPNLTDAAALAKAKKESQQ